MRKRTTAKSQAAAPGRGPRRSRLVDALFAGAEPREALVARALLDQQDAEHKLREAKAHKADAEGHSPRARVQTVEEAEAAWVAMRKEAIGELRIANNLLSEASASLDSAQQLKTQTEDILQQAGGHTASVRTEVNALQATAIAEARQQADADRQEFVRKATADTPSSGGRSKRTSRASWPTSTRCSRPSKRSSRHSARSPTPSASMPSPTSTRPSPASTSAGSQLVGGPTPNLRAPNSAPPLRAHPTALFVATPWAPILALRIVECSAVKARQAPKASAKARLAGSCVRPLRE